ncbi:MAG: DNA mismatch repair endonuclease MutL [Phycisphaerae bacterium]|nr:DNA mismatch repair endonuclease MutL [Phycisphaerae bacterium]
MAKINVLSQNLINKIAAGEVVERPASVVKELMENSLDAGAKKVILEVEDGGKKLIKVSDDGWGMNKEDIGLCIQPHATSKLATDEDLFNISTLGFRGEAMPSIGSVSQMEIISRSSDDIQGWKIIVDGGDIKGPEPVSASQGTSISVRNLFFNTPARRKFMRATNTEMSHITEQFTRIVLAHCNVRFELIHNGRKIYELPENQSFSQRVGMLFSKQLGDSLLSIERHDRGVRLNGLIAPPQQNRNNTQWQYVFLNGRYIRDKFVSHAIREGYRGMMEINRQPIVFLFIEIDPSMVDVNVHPTKIEVRFVDSNAVHGQVRAAIRDKLLNADLAVKLDSDKFKNVATESKQPTEEEKAEQQKLARQKMAEFFKSVDPVRPQADKAQSTFEENIQPQTDNFKLNTETKPVNTFNFDSFKQSIDSSMGSEDNAAEVPQMPAQPQSSEPVAGPQYTSKFLQIHNSFIVEQDENGLTIIDQHALHERVMYESMFAQISKGPLACQRALIPEVVDVTHRQLDAIEQYGPLLNKLGFYLEQFGPGTIAVQGYPVILSKAAPAELVGDLLDVLIDQDGKVSREQLVHNVLDMMACKAAVKAGDSLTEVEMKHLLSQRQDVQRSGNCPHGRPTEIRMSLKELEKLFKRT